MKKTLRRILAGTIAVAMLASMCGCRTIAVSQFNNGNPIDLSFLGIHWNTDQGGTDPIDVSNMTFDEYCDYLFEEDLASDAFSAHFKVKDASAFGVSFKEEDYTLGRYTEAEEKEAYETVKKYLQTLRSYDRDSLTDNQKLTYDCLEQYYENSLAYEGTYGIAQMFAPSSGVLASLNSNLCEYTFFNEEDVTNYFALVKTLPALMEDVYAYTRQQAENGYFMDAYNVDKAIEQCDSYLTADLNPYIGTFEDRIEAIGLSSDKVEEYKKQNEELVKNCITPVYEDSKALLTELHDAGKGLGGLCNYGEIGKKYYNAILKNKTSTNMDADQIIDLLDDTMDRYWNELVSIYTYDNASYVNFAYFTIDESTFGTPDDDLQYLLKHINDASNKETFPKIVTDHYNVSYLNPASEVSTTLAYYMVAPIDDVTQNDIRVNKSAVSENLLEMYRTLAHEGYPGHLYQFTSFYSNPEVPNIRKQIDFLGYCEGWAEYAASCAVSYLDMNENMQALSNVNSAINDVLCSRVDLGVNVEGWTRDDVKEYVTQFFTDDGTYSDTLYYTLTASPGLLLPYTVGYVLMCDAREKAEDELGADFDVVAFHDFVINQVGTVPFNILDEELEKWIDAQ